MATALQNETLLTALNGVGLTSLDRDPVAFIKAQNRLFSAVLPFFGLARTEAMTDEELTQAASVKAAAILSNGDR